MTVTDADEGVCFLTTADLTTDIMLPDDATAQLRLGTIFHVVQGGAGAARFVATGRTALQLMPGFLPETRGPFAAVSVLKIAPDTWRIQGDAAIASGAPPFANGGALAGVLSLADETIRLDASHAGRLIEASAPTPVSVVVTGDPSVPIGTTVHVVQAGDGILALRTEIGVQLLHCRSRLPESSGRDGIIVLQKTGAATWRASGDLALVRAFS